MLALRDENIVNAAEAARQVHGKSHLAPKTPGARFPKTPSKIPLNDENAVGGKTALKPKGTGLKQRNLVTPSETQSRAPLGNKTTNAKARAGNALGVKDIVNEFEKTQQAKPTTVKKVRQKTSSLDPLRVAVLNDKKSSEEPDVESAPPRAQDLPYESDVFPGTLSFEGLKQENVLKGYYNYFYNPVGEDGKRLLDRQHDERMAKALKENDEAMLREIDTMDWSIAGMPGSDKLVKKKTAPVANPTALQNKKTGLSTSKCPPTINSRKAASALSMATGSTIRQNKVPEKAPARRPVSALLPGKRTVRPVAPLRTAAGESAVAEATSRSTLGYTKGRSASSLLSGRPQAPNAQREAVKPALVRPDPDATIRPRHAENVSRDDGQLPQRLQLLSIFDPEEDDIDLGGKPHFDGDLDDDDFELKLA